MSIKIFSNPPRNRIYLAATSSRKSTRSFRPDQYNLTFSLCRIGEVPRDGGGGRVAAQGRLPVQRRARVSATRGTENRLRPHGSSRSLQHHLPVTAATTQVPAHVRHGAARAFSGVRRQGGHLLHFRPGRVRKGLGHEAGVAWVKI